jgi:ATP-binding cassette, subfamily F, member 3
MRGRTALAEVIGANEKISALARRIKMYEEQLCNPALDSSAMGTILQKMGEDQTAYEKLGGTITVYEGDYPYYLENKAARH